jgi:hypothetical protein
MEAARRHSAAGVVGATLWGVTAKEKLRERVETLSEQEADETLRLLEDWKPGDVVDEWGNLSALTRSSAARTMRRLDEEERAERGETIGEAWEREGLR